MARILHIIGTLNPEAGGPSAVVRGLIEHGPRESGAEVVTLDDPNAEFLRDVGFPVHALGPVASTYGHTRKLVPWLRANRDRFDGVIVHGLWQYCGYAVWRGLNGRIPYAVFPHGMLDPYFKRAFPLKHLKKWLYWITAEYWVLRNAFRVLFTCELEKSLAEESFWLRRWTPRVVPFGTVPPPGDLVVQREAFLRVCPELRGRRFLLFLGRINPKKGCDLLVDAYAKLAASHPDLDLVMAGPDKQDWRVQLEARAQASGVADRIHWPGMLHDDEKWGAFYASEAFVLPSHQENFGIAVMEALACGRPVLLSDKVNTAVEIVGCGAGLMERDSLEGTGRLLQRWLALQAAEREAMGRRAEACFQMNYDMRKNAEKIFHFFEPTAAPHES